MAEKNTKTSKSKQDINTTPEQNSEVTKTFPLDWDSVIRIIGSIAGITGIFTAILFIYGYAYYVGQLRAMNISDRVFASTPDQSYLLRQGVTSFIYFAIHIGIFFLIYYLLQSIVRIIGKHISSLTIIHGWKFTTFGIALGAIVILGGSYYSLRRTPPEHIIAVALSILIGIEIILTVSKLTQIDVHEHFKTDSLYYVLTRAISTTKVIGVVLTVCLLFTFHLGNSNALGSYFICNDIQFNSTSVVLFSEKPIAIEGEVNNGNSFKYDGYSLLLVDNNNYFLYREFQPNTVKPKSVYIVKKDSLIGVEFTKSSNPIDWNNAQPCFNPYSNPTN